jgi:two-component system, OmpR family, response regulator
VLIDDDPLVGPLVQAAVGIPTIAFPTVQAALQEEANLHPCAVFLDLQLPEESGLHALGRLRKIWNHCPLIVITSDKEESALVESLTLGADDFIEKPLRPKELASRLRVRLIDHTQRKALMVLECADISLDLPARTLKGPGGTRYLSPTELNVLSTMMRSPDMAIERTSLKNQCWNGIAVSENALDRKIFEVRRALLDVSSECVIETVYRLGFVLRSIEFERRVSQ